jgi:hypothetical protein
MEVNDRAFARWSTYANLVSMVVSAALISLPDIGLEAVTVARLMMAGNVIIAGCQFVKQQEIQK